MFKSKTKCPVELIVEPEAAAEAKLSRSESCFVKPNKLSNFNQLSMWLMTPISFCLSFCAFRSYICLTSPLWNVGPQPVYTHMAIVASIVGFLLLCFSYGFLTGWNRYDNSKKEFFVFTCGLSALILISHADLSQLFQQIQTYFVLPTVFLLACAFRKVGRFASERASDLTRELVNQSTILTGAVMFLIELSLCQCYRYARPLEVNFGELIVSIILPPLLVLCRVHCRDFRIAAQFGLFLQAPLIAAVGLNIVLLSLMAFLNGAQNSGYLSLSSTIMLKDSQGLAVKLGLLVLLSSPVVLGPVLASAIAVHLNRLRLTRLLRRTA